MTKQNKRNIIIGSLCVVVLLMAVGYAAFQTALNIQGTSNITSSWNIKITNVESKNVTGTATNIDNPTWEDLTASFKAGLQSPGDSIEYDITVKNEGSLNAKLDKINFFFPGDPAIVFRKKGMAEGDIINAGSTAVLTVKVEYSSSVTSQPTVASSTIRLELEYSQATASAPAGESAIDKLTANVVTSGDGLYEDTYESGRYVYKGYSAANYITFDSELWRIMAIETDGTIKLIKSRGLGAKQWDNNSVKEWGMVSLSTYLNTDYYNSSFQASKALILDHDFNIGRVVYNNSDLISQIQSEKSKIWNGKIGLPSVSDIIKANSNVEQCGNMELNNINKEICKQSSYLFFDYMASLRTINIEDKQYGHPICVGDDRQIGGVAYGYADVMPAVYIKSDILLTGEGTKANPYVIV